VRRATSGLAATAALAGAAFTLLALTVDSTAPASWERSWTRWVYDLRPPSTRFLGVVMQAGTRGAILVVALVFALLRRWRPTAAALVAGWGAWATVETTKLLVDRVRPDPALLGRVPRELMDTPGFPSSHAGIASALATVVFLTVRRPPVVRWLAIAVAVLVGIARVHLALHWPLDVIGGGAAGVCMGTLAALLCGCPVTRGRPTTSAKRGHRPRPYSAGL
jgi:membrane-associated phospholipid phosphatase